jgi:hypothetical protein
MISRELADAVISIISSECERLSKLASDFSSCCSRGDQLSVLTSLGGLLMNDILDPPQQIVTVWLLRSSFSNVSIQENPFYHVFVFILQSGTSNSNTYSQKLCDIIGCFLSSSDSDDLKDRSVHEILDHDFSIDSTGTADLIPLAFGPIPRISPVIVSKADASASQITQHQLLRELLIDTSLWTDFDVPFNRQAPEISAPSLEELQYMHISSVDAPPFVFDEGRFLDAHGVAPFFWPQCAERVLLPWEISLLTEYMKKQSNFLGGVVLERPYVEKVLQINPRIGGLLAVEYGNRDPNFVPSLLQVLEKGEITAGSTDVLRELAGHKLLTDEFLDAYVLNGTQVLTAAPNNQALRTKTAVFANFLLFLHQAKVTFSAKALLDINSLETDLARKGIAERSILMDLINNAPV